MKIHSAWPNEAQEVLLKAAVFPPEKAEIYWREFIGRFDLQTLDHGCNQMLPMVYINLKDRLGDGTEKWTCRSAYKYVWANNHLLMHDLKTLLVRLREDNIRVCILKGAAYIGHYFPDYGMRVMGDVDLLVPVPQMDGLIDCLESNGYKVSSIQDDTDARRLLKIFNARSFVSERGTEIDAHQYLSQFLGGVKFNEKLWASARPINLFGLKNIAYVLNPACQLIHTVTHGLQYAPESSIRWIVDAANLLRNHSEDVDWEELKDICLKHHLNLPMKLALLYLREELNQPIPDHVISHFTHIKITDKDKEYYEVSSNLSFSYALRKMIKVWGHYRVYTAKSSVRFNPIEFYDFLVLYTKRKSRWALVPHAFKKLMVLAGKAVLAPVRLISNSGKQVG